MDIHTVIENIIIPRIQEPLWGHWYIKERIGSGSFSYVYRVEGKNAKGEMESRALKVSVATPDRIFSSEEQRLNEIEKRKSMIINEIEIMKRLQDCLNIVRYYDEGLKEFDINGTFAGYYSLIQMELVTPLIYDRLFSSSEEEVVALAKQLGKGIEYAHQKGIIHRDIKPDNIFVSFDRIYKLGDFNVSKESETANSIAGAPWYMAPEIWLAQSVDGNPYTTQADIYSFGICLYEMMNENRLPFENDKTNRDEAVKIRRNKQAVKNGFPEPKNASSAFSKIIQKACAFDPMNRYHTMTEMLKDLEKLEYNKTSRPSSDNKEHNGGYQTQYADGDDEKGGNKGGHQPVNYRLLLTSGSLAICTIVIITVAHYFLNKSKPPSGPIDDHSAEITDSNTDNNQNQDNQTVCPICGDTITVQQDKLEAGRMFCPNCGNELLLFSSDGLYAEGATTAVTSPPTKEPTTSTTHEPTKNKPTTQRIYFPYAKSSSVLDKIEYNGKTYTYYPTNAADGDIQTCWCEGAEGEGIGEGITFYSDSPRQLNKIVIYNGLCDDEETYYNNSRIKKCRIDFSDSSYIEIDFLGDIEEQPLILTIPETVSTTSVTFTILDTFHGKKYSDTCLSEVEFYYVN